MTEKLKKFNVTILDVIDAIKTEHAELLTALNGNQEITEQFFL